MYRILCLLIGFFVIGCGEQKLGTQNDKRLSVAETLGASGEGYAKAMAPRDFIFPADHGPHPDFKTEWWYYTGNLATEGGRRFGYQLTFFRIALTPEPEARQSAWATNQIYMAHFAVTDVAEESFFSAERFARSALGLAGATALPFRVWLEDWRAYGEEEIFPMTLHAATDRVGLELTLAQGKPIVFQGDQGLSQKSDEPGNASYYYSLTRMPTTGKVRIGEETFNVQGSSWLDREWSTSALAENQAGWDWFALQLNDGLELMYYQLRRKDGTPDPASKGIWVLPDGTTRLLEREDVALEVNDTWTSSASGGTYPSGWRLRVPDLDLDLTIEPLLEDQELDTSIRYWEGAVKIEGTRGGEPVSGYGYVELTGYAD